MEKIITIVFVALGAVFISALVKKYAPDYSVAISICATVIIIFFILTELTEALDFFENLMSEGSINGQWINSIVKVTVISFVGQWGVGICRDAGENSIAEKIELAVKVMILVICLPYIKILFTVADEIN